MERDKKNYEKMDFCSQPPAFLIDLYPAQAPRGLFRQKLRGTAGGRPS